MTGWSGLASGRVGSGGFRGIENIYAQNKRIRGPIKRSQTAVGGPQAGPRRRGVALAASRALTFGTRRVHNSNNKMSAKTPLLYVRPLRPLLSLRMPSIGHTDLIQTLFSAERLSGLCQNVRRATRMTSRIRDTEFADVTKYLSCYITSLK